MKFIVDELTGRPVDGRRIRWKKTHTPGVWVSERALYSTTYKRYYEVSMDENALNYKIYDPLNGKTVYNSTEKFASAGMLRRGVRKKMQQLGIELGLEIRYPSEKVRKGQVADKRTKAEKAKKISEATSEMKGEVNEKKSVTSDENERRVDFNNEKGQS